MTKLATSGGRPFMKANSIIINKHARELDALWLVTAVL